MGTMASVQLLWRANISAAGGADRRGGAGVATGVVDAGDQEAAAGALGPARRRLSALPGCAAQDLPRTGAELRRALLGETREPTHDCAQ